MIICSAPGCQTSAGCQCGGFGTLNTVGRVIYSPDYRSPTSLAMPPSPEVAELRRQLAVKDAEIMRLQGQLSQMRRILSLDVPSSQAGFSIGPNGLVKDW